MYSAYAFLASTVAGKAPPKKVVPGGKSTATTGKGVPGKKAEPTANGKGIGGMYINMQSALYFIVS